MCFLRGIHLARLDSHVEACFLSSVMRIQASRIPVSFVGRKHCGTESEHQVLNCSRIFVFFMRILVLCGIKLQ